MNVPLVLFDQAVDRGKAESRALADGLGREEGFEQLLANGLFDAGSRVDDPERDHVAGARRAGLGELAEPAGFERQRSAAPFE